VTGWKEIVNSSPKVDLKCKEVPMQRDDKLLKCEGIKFLEGNMNDFEQYGGIRIMIEEFQGR